MKQPFIRASNLLVSGFSYLRSTVSGNPSVAGMPVAISAELTNHCNLKCPECASGSGLMKRERGFMNISLFEKVIDELEPYLLNINLYFQGEPMLHPRFYSFIEGNRGIHTEVSTNGHFLTPENSEKLVESGLSKLIISLDGADQETYSAYRRNGNFETVISGIKAVIEAKKKRPNSSLSTEIQLLVNRQNEKQIGAMRKLAANMNIPLRLKSMQILGKDSIDWWSPSQKNFSRYHLKSGKFVLKNSLPNRCSRAWLNPAITWDGKVVPCCFDKDAEYIMGDLNNDSFRDIWNGTKYRLFRKSILTGRHMIEMCRNCTSGLNLKY